MIAAGIHPCFTLVAQCPGMRSKGRRGWVRNGTRGRSSQKGVHRFRMRGAIHDISGVEGAARQKD